MLADVKRLMPGQDKNGRHTGTPPVSFASCARSASDVFDHWSPSLFFFQKKAPKNNKRKLLY
jgi:hypothetical protein